MTFNPAPYVHTAKQTYDLKLQYDAFLAKNPHLAAPFHITGLESILPPQFPSQVAVHFAKSHEGKSTALRNAIFKAQRRVEGTDSMVAIVSLEDSAETTAAKFVMRYKDESLRYQDDQMLFIGNSFGMNSKDMGQLSIENIIMALEYGLKQHPGIKRYAHILVDYVQIIPQSKNASSNDRRDQAMFATRQLFDAAKQFQCPVDFASQALLKHANTQYGGSKMRIPGAGDLKEAAELYEIPHIAIAYWMPKRQQDTPIGSHIDEGSWSFNVESNLMEGL
jgi:replicative DNA helicase